MAHASPEKTSPRASARGTPRARTWSGGGTPRKGLVSFYVDFGARKSRDGRGIPFCESRRSVRRRNERFFSSRAGLATSPTGNHARRSLEKMKIRRARKMFGFLGFPSIAVRSGPPRAVERRPTGRLGDARRVREEKPKPRRVARRAGGVSVAGEPSRRSHRRDCGVHPRRAMSLVVRIRDPESLGGTGTG